MISDAYSPYRPLLVGSMQQAADGKSFSQARHQKPHQHQNYGKCFPFSVKVPHSTSALIWLVNSKLGSSYAKAYLIYLTLLVGSMLQRLCTLTLPYLTTLPNLTFSGGQHAAGSTQQVVQLSTRSRTSKNLVFVFVPFSAKAPLSAPALTCLFNQTNFLMPR